MNFLNRVDRIITDEDNQRLQQPPTNEEVKEVILSLYPDSVVGPDGFNGRFY